MITNLPLYKGDHQERCNVCFERGLLLCCDYCPLSYHPQCVLPVIESQPEDYWICPQCGKDLLDGIFKTVMTMKVNFKRSNEPSQD